MTAEDEDEDGGTAAISIGAGGGGGTDGDDDGIGDNGIGGVGGRKAALGVTGTGPCACASLASRSCFRASCLSRRRSLILRPTTCRAGYSDETRCQYKKGDQVIFDLASCHLLKRALAPALALMLRQSPGWGLPRLAALRTRTPTPKRAGATVRLIRRSCRQWCVVEWQGEKVGRGLSGK